MPINYLQYGEEFKVKSLVLRGFGKCAVCGAANRSPSSHSGALVVLTVHHIDLNWENHELLNLVPLCQACHLAAHKSGAAIVKPGGEYVQWLDVVLRFVCYVVKEEVSGIRCQVSGDREKELTKSKRGKER